MMVECWALKMAARKATKVGMMAAMMASRLG